MNAAETLTTLFSHNRWANLSLLEVCSGLNDAQLDSTILGVYGTIRATLEHIVMAERSYLSRISTGKRYHHPADAPPLTLAEMHAASSASGAGLIEWAPKIQAGESVQVDWDGAMVDVPLTVLLTQAIDHATEHRAQIMAMLTQLGIEPPELDAWAYFGALRQSQA